VTTTVTVTSAVACVQVSRQATVTASDVATTTSLGEKHPFFAVYVDVTALAFPTSPLRNKKEEEDAKHRKRGSKKLEFHLMFSGSRCVFGSPPMAQ
jgi:CMP-N-acetylneuraminic acid synthetase